jgi:hypothetical protein
MRIRIRQAKEGEAKERKIKTTIDGVNKAIAQNKIIRPDTIPAHKNQIVKLKNELKEAFGQFGQQPSGKDDANPDKDKKQKEKDSFADFYRGYNDKDELKQKAPDKLILFPSKKDLVEKIIQLRKKGL